MMLLLLPIDAIGRAVLYGFTHLIFRIMLLINYFDISSIIDSENAWTGFCANAAYDAVTEFYYGYFHV